MRIGGGRKRLGARVEVNVNNRVQIKPKRQSRRVDGLFRHWDGIDWGTEIIPFMTERSTFQRAGAIYIDNGRSHENAHVLRYKWYQKKSSDVHIYMKI